MRTKAAPSLWTDFRVTSLISSVGVIRGPGFSNHSAQHFGCRSQVFQPPFTLMETSGITLPSDSHDFLSVTAVLRAACRLICHASCHVLNFLGRPSPNLLSFDYGVDSGTEPVVLPLNYACRAIPERLVRSVVSFSWQRKLRVPHYMVSIWSLHRWLEKGS